MDQILSLSAIRQRKAELLNTINDAKAQMSDLDVAEQIVIRFGHEAGPGAGGGFSIGMTPTPTVFGPMLTADKVKLAMPDRIASAVALTVSQMTTRNIFLSILRQSSELWITANEIQERASGIKGQPIPMGTVSPTLSLMKNDGLIVRDGLKVALTDRVKKAEAPNGSAAGAPDGRAPTLLDHQPPATND